MSQTRASDPFTVRPATLDDARDIVNLRNACAVERTRKPATNLYAVQGAMQMPSLDLEGDTLLAHCLSGQLAGLALCHPEMSEDPEMAWVHVVGVRPAWRQHRIALALLQHSFAALYRAGKRKVSLEVDAEHPTGITGLYRKAGMHVAYR